MRDGISVKARFIKFKKIFNIIKIFFLNFSSYLYKLLLNMIFLRGYKDKTYNIYTVFSCKYSIECNYLNIYILSIHKTQNWRI